jgi:hypothetical protein
VVIIKFHPRNSRFICGTHAEATHSSSVHIKGTVRQKEQEQSIVRFLRIRDMLREIGVIVDSIESGRIEDAEARVCVLAVQTFLI